MTVDRHDPVLGALADLPAPSLSAAYDARVRSRCHAAMGAAKRQPSSRQTVVRIIDRLLPLAVVVYGVATFVEGLRLAGLI